MNNATASMETITDFITGRPAFNIGAEANRQKVEQFLVEQKGYDREDIEVDAHINLNIDGERQQSNIDLVVCVNGFRYMVIKCAAGSLASREREVISAARLLDRYQIPICVASDGITAFVWDTVTGMRIGMELDAIPSKEEAQSTFDPEELIPLDPKRRDRIKLIFRTYVTRSCSNKGPV